MNVDAAITIGTSFFSVTSDSVSV